MVAHSLTQDEARERAAGIRVSRMVVALDLDRGPENFLSRTEIHFSAAWESTFVELQPVAVHRVTLNGTELDPAGVRDGRLPLSGLAADNILVVEAEMAYRRDGSGLHRSVDPADGEAYVYGHLFLDAAPSVFACFDQPDLKAPYAVSVTAPAHWRVLGNGVATQPASGRWELAPTPPLATYFVTICAGPWVSVEREHDGIPLGVHARQALGEPLAQQADALLDLTAGFLDYYHELFGIRYPFGAYHQVFCPEFNAGAMENAGCVTIRDTSLFRGAAAHDEQLTRANTIAHELAHMWFGDLVTLRWWDDLWLNESFAEYLAHRASVAASPYDDAWVDSTMARRLWGHTADRSPSTHPVAGAPAPDARSALTNLDGISYAKGSAVLRQLIARVGDDAFLRGLRDHLQRNAFGNAELQDFLDAIGAAAGESLADWSRVWLQEAGIDTLTVHQDTGRVTRSAPPGATRAGRPHTVDVAGYIGGREVFRVSGRVERATQKWPELAQAERAEVVLPNAGDLTWAISGLEPETLANLPAGLGAIPDPQARAVAWLALIDGVHEARVDPTLLLDAVEQSWPRENNESILSRVAAHTLTRIIPGFLAPQRQSVAHERVAQAARWLGEAAMNPGMALIAARTLARTSHDEAQLRGWLAGTDLPTQLAEDSDFRWLVVRALARLGFMDADEIEFYRRRDDSLPGQQAALSALALRPTPEAKAWAWTELTANPDRSNYELNALADSFWTPMRPELTRAYVARYFTDIPPLARRLGEDALGHVATLAYPVDIVEPATLAASQAALDAAGVADVALTPAVRRAIVDAQAKLTEGLRSRECYEDKVSG